VLRVGVLKIEEGNLKTENRSQLEKTVYVLRVGVLRISEHLLLTSFFNPPTRKPVNTLQLLTLNQEL
jgi:hypothetical protein